MPIDLSSFIARIGASALARWSGEAPWHITGQAASRVAELARDLDAGYSRQGEAAVHRTATVEPGAVIKGPAIVGPGCLVAAGAYLRGGVWLEEECTIGPGSEVKSSFVFRGSALAHFNFIGDSIIGAGVNFEAGSVIANHRNERADKQVRVRLGGERVNTGVDKFGALVGDRVRIGANAVIAPGALIARGEVVPRLSLIDQDPG